VTSPPETPHRNKKFFFDFDYKTCWICKGFEQLSSSIAWRIIGLQILQEKWRTRDLKAKKSWKQNEFWILFIGPFIDVKVLGDK